MVHTVDEVFQRIREHFRVGVDLLHCLSPFPPNETCPTKTYHQTNFEEVRRDTHENMDFAEKIEVERCHPVVVCDTREEVHEDQLTVTLATVTRLFVGRGLRFSTTLYDNDGGRAATSNSYSAVSDGFNSRGTRTHCNVRHTP